MGVERKSGGGKMFSGRLILFCTVLILLAVPVQAEDERKHEQPVLVLDMEQAVKTGLERNPRIKAMDFGIRRSQSQTKSVRGQFLPSASVGSGYTRLDSIAASGPTEADYLDQTRYHWNLRVVQPLFAGLTILSSYQQARIEEEISTIEKEAEERALIREIQFHFLELLKAREDRRSLESAMERLEVGLEASRTFFEERLVPYVDVLQSEVELEETRQELNMAINEERIQMSELNALLGFEFEKMIKYVGELERIPVEKVIDLQQALDFAFANRTDLMFIQKNMQIVDKEKRIARGGKLPRVNLEFNYTDQTRDFDQHGRDIHGRDVDRDQRNRYWTAGVTLEWNFFSGGRNYYRYQSMDHEIQRLVQILENARNSITTEVRTSSMRLEEARERLISTRKALAAAAENYDMQEHRYKQRVGTILDLLTAQEHLTRAEAGRNQALLDYQQAMAELYYAMGMRSYALD